MGVFPYVLLIEGEEGVWEGCISLLFSEGGGVEKVPFPVPRGPHPQFSHSVSTLISPPHTPPCRPAPETP